MICRLARLALSLAGLLAMVGALAAAPSDPPPSWASLTAGQRAALSPLEHDWHTIDAPRKQKWLEVADRFPGMSVAERQRVQARMAEWARMSPAERTRARMQFREARALSPSEREAKWRAYQALSPEEKRKLAQQAHPPVRSASASGKSTTPPGTRPSPVPTSRPVTPIVVQAAPGATTTTLTPKPPRPRHHDPSATRLAASPAQVDPATLLPRRQAASTGGAASRAAPAAAPSVPSSR